MNVRIIGMAAALVVAAACKTSGSQSRGGTAQAPPAGQGPATASDAQGGAGGQAGQDPLMEPGPEVKAHASDQIVAGEIGEVSPTAVTIQTDQGDTKKLDLADETSITVDGEDATAAELQEGQQVRASFNEVDGREVAVKLEVEAPSPLGASGSPATPEPGAETIPEPLPGSPSDTGPGGSSGSTGTGSSGDAPDAGPTPPHW